MTTILAGGRRANYFPGGIGFAGPIDIVRRRRRLSLNFLAGEAIDPRLTFTRPSGATRVNSAGLIELVGNNMPRFDYDPVTHAPRGILVESARTNLLLRSAEFDNAIWLKQAGGTGSMPVVIPNDAVAPDGSQSADRITFNRGAGTGSEDFSRIRQSVGGINASAAYAGGFYVKAASAADIGKTLLFRHVSSAGHTSIILTSDYQRMGSVETALTTSANFELTIRGDFASSQSVGFHIWGARLEAGAYATSDISTVGSQVTRAADVPGVSISDWFNPAEGTFVVEYDTIWTGAPGTASGLLGLNSSSTMRLAYFSSGSNSIAAYDGTNATIAPGIAAGTGPHRALIGYDAASIFLRSNNAATATGPRGTLFDDAHTLNVGHFGTGAQLGGHVRRLRYAPRLLSDQF